MIEERFWTKNEIDVMNRIRGREDERLLLSVFSILFYLKPLPIRAERQGNKGILYAAYPAYPQVVRILKRYMSGKAARKLIAIYTDAQSVQPTIAGLRWVLDPSVVDKIAEALKSIKVNKQIYELGDLLIAEEEEE